MDERMDQTTPKLLRIIAAKKLHGIPTVMTTSKSQEPEVISVSTKTTAHVEKEEIPEEKAILQEHTPAEVTEEIKADDLIAPEIAEIETSVADASKDVADEDKIPNDILDETTKTYVACPQKKPEEKSQKPILCKCGLPSDSSDHSCSIAKCAKDHVSCPQKKSEEEPQKFTFCKRELSSDPNNYLCSIVKCTKCNSTVEDCPCKDSGLERKTTYCAHLPTMQCTCTPISHLKSCLKAGKPKFVSPLKISSHICTNCCKTRKERKCRKTAICCRSHEECRCRWCAMRSNCSRINDERK